MRRGWITDFSKAVDEDFEIFTLCESGKKQVMKELLLRAVRNAAERKPKGRNRTLDLPFTTFLYPFK